MPSYRKMSRLIHRTHTSTSLVILGNCFNLFVTLRLLGGYLDQ